MLNLERTYVTRDKDMKEMLDGITIEDAEFISSYFGVAFPANDGHVGYEVGGMNSIKLARFLF